MHDPHGQLLWPARAASTREVTVWHGATGRGPMPLFRSSTPTDSNTFAIIDPSHSAESHAPHLSRPPLKPLSMGKCIAWSCRYWCCCFHAV
jgi:hypothetical protein